MARRMWPLSVLAFAAIAYLLILAAVFFLQTALLFPTHLVRAAGPLPPGARRLVVDTPDGERLYGLHIPPVRSAGGKPPAILGFGGNAWHAVSVAAYLHELYPAADVVAFHYRGYAPSTGRPSAEALLADAPLLHDQVRDSLDADRVVAVGFSIGGAVAAHLASRRPLAGLILVTPFDSLAALSHDHYPWLPIGLLLRHRMEPAQGLARVGVPTAVIAGGGDTLVPRRRTDALRRAIPNLVLDRTIEDAGHDDIYTHPTFPAAMTEALHRLDSGQAPKV